MAVSRVEGTAAELGDSEGVAMGVEGPASELWG